MQRSPDFEIRLAAAADATIIAGFSSACALESENLALDPELIRMGVEATFSDPDRGHYYLAFRAGEPVGQIMITREWSDWRNAWIWWIQSVYVCADARRSGVFSALLDHVRAEARHAAAAALRLYVDKNNAAAENTYLARGFEPAHYRMLEGSVREG